MLVLLSTNFANLSEQFPISRNFAFCVAQSFELHIYIFFNVTWQLNYYFTGTLASIICI